MRAAPRVLTLHPGQTRWAMSSCGWLAPFRLHAMQDQGGVKPELHACFVLSWTKQLMTTTIGIRYSCIEFSHQMPQEQLISSERHLCGVQQGRRPAKLAGARRVGFAVGTGPEGMACCRGGPQELCAYCGALGGGGLPNSRQHMSAKVRQGLCILPPHWLLSGKQSKAAQSSLPRRW